MEKKKELTPEIFLWHVVLINMSNKLLAKPDERKRRLKRCLQRNKTQIGQVAAISFAAFRNCCGNERMEGRKKKKKNEMLSKSNTGKKRRRETWFHRCE